MACPHCGSSQTQEQEQKTSLGYRTFRCPACKRHFNERSGTPFNDLSVPTDIVFLVVLWRLRYPLSLRHLAEMFLERGFVFSHETVRQWEALVAPLLTEQLRRRRRGKAGRRWHADETYVKIQGVWCYLYRAIDADENLVDSMLSLHRDLDACPGRKAYPPKKARYYGSYHQPQSGGTFERRSTYSDCKDVAVSAENGERRHSLCRNRSVCRFQRPVRARNDAECRLHACKRYFHQLQIAAGGSLRNTGPRSVSASC